MRTILHFINFNILTQSFCFFRTCTWQKDNVQCHSALLIDIFFAKSLRFSRFFRVGSTAISENENLGSPAFYSCFAVGVFPHSGGIDNLNNKPQKNKE